KASSNAPNTNYPLWFRLAAPCRYGTTAPYFEAGSGYQILHPRSPEYHRNYCLILQLPLNDAICGFLVSQRSSSKIQTSSEYLYVESCYWCLRELCTGPLFPWEHQSTTRLLVGSRRLSKPARDVF